MLFLFFDFFNFCGFKTLAILVLTLLSEIYRREKNIRFFFPKTFLATLPKFAPKINHWPNHCSLVWVLIQTMEPPMPFLIRFLRKNSNLVLFGNGVQFYLEHSSRLDAYWRSVLVVYFQSTHTLNLQSSHFRMTIILHEKNSLHPMTRFWHKISTFPIFNHKLSEYMKPTKTTTV